MNELTEQEAQLVAEHQANLLFETERFFENGRIPKPIRRAFLKTPRHLFAPRFYSSQNRQWIELEATAIRPHIAELYSDHPLGIYRDQNGRSLSTISQPSLVLYMLALLELEQGHQVFELGGGSGWNAALMARLVGDIGSVTSIEIIEDLVENAQNALSKLGMRQVFFTAGDASLGSPNGEKFDRGVFTASAWELPACFFEQIKDGGLLLFVLKAQPNYDLLCQLKKSDDDVFSSQLHFTCSFVPVTGSCKLPELQATSVAQMGLDLVSELTWEDIKIPDAAIPNFIEFVKLVFDCQATYLLPRHGLDFDEEFWGIHNPEQDSAILFNEDRVQAYGQDHCLVQLRRAAKRWQKAGSPEREDLKLSIHRSASGLETSNDQWLVQRGETALLWSL
ncbi:protein-L-isoaspartate O-methyltransferase [Pelagicoccus sp. SDUM812002]|uniref:protein-L-isoaspartate O-methyltransferase family protein n=1 Tax=Pelagicoccus sp. SDUM812002 TaxID=3041266 RepID=UPI00280FF214|nr:protein-L-isoaspartate O-methyltransferase [Pelagicoccus sp. SDUM812002]MDQ8184359.1 protein-L-isoaspartate O-methyltransferase [Pelagicoccus sp. SDUM812002]